MLNQTDDTRLKELYREMDSRSKATVVVEVLLWTCLCLSSFIGNLFALLAMYRNRRLRTTTNMFLISLAVSDLGFSVTNALPLGAPALALGRWPFGYDACQYQGYIAMVVAGASIQTLAWTAINRFFRVVKPSKYKLLFDKKKTVTHIIVTWAMSFILPGIFFASGERYVFHPTKFLCFLTLEYATLNLAVIAFAILVPAIIICYCYLRVFFTVRRHNLQISQSGKVNVEEIRVTKTFFTIVFTYLCCWMPALAIDIVDFLSGKWLMPHWVYYLYGFLAILSSVTNPVIYVLMNPIFRTEYLRLISFLSFTNNKDKVINISVIGGNSSHASRTPGRSTMML